MLINAKSCKKRKRLFLQNLGKKKSTYLQDIPFISISFAINTNKCKILQKRKRLFREIFHLLVHVLLFVLVNAESCKKETTFSRYIAFISTCFIVNTSKCKILQKRKRLFREILHLLVHVSILILINAKSCKKENEFFARYSIYILFCKKFVY